MSAKAAGANESKKPAVKQAGGNTTVTKTAVKAGAARSAVVATSSKNATAKKATAGTKTAREPKTSQSVPAVAPVEVSHRIHALLHTIHQIERYEERLCSMQDAIKRTGKLNAPLLRDLKDLLEEIPSREYQHDLDAVRDAVLG